MKQDQTMLRESLGAHGPCWLIGGCTTTSGAGADVLTLGTPKLGEVLPIFGREEEALCFLQCMVSSEPRSGLKVVYIGRMRLSTMLQDSLARIDRVLFDPLPGAGLPGTVELTSLGRAAFVDLLLGRGRTWSAREEGD